MNIKLPFWMEGETILRVSSVLENAWETIQAAIRVVNTFDDAEQCPEHILHMLAWQRGIERIPGEDEPLFRRRVKYALANARDAGSVGGFIRIWNRLELGTVLQQERADSEEWDVILIQIDQARFARYRGLFEQLVTLYGRTCRRYALTENPVAQPLGLRPFPLDVETSNAKAIL